MKSFYMYVIVLLAVFAMVSAYSITADCAPGGPEPRENSVVNTTQPIDGSDRITWTTLPPSPAMARYWCPGTGVVRDTIYFLGGRGSPTGTLAEIIAYVPANNSWVTTGLPTLLTPRRTGGGGRIGNKIYVAGGRDASNTLLSSCEEFDVDTKFVTTKAPMPSAMYACASAVAGGKLYIIGSELPGTNCYEYDPATNTWATKAPIPVSRGWAAAAGAGGKVYVFGGCSGPYLKDCYEFDPATNTWTAKESMPTTREYHSAVTVNDQDIYIIGGNTAGGAAENVVYKYNIAGDTWTTEAPIPTARGWEMLNVVGSAIYASFGCNDWSTPVCLNTNERGSLVPLPRFDAAVSAILSPGHMHLLNTPMIPQATLINLGTETVTFSVRCSVVNMTGAVRHENTQTITLAGQRDTTVTFTSWTPTVTESLNAIVRTCLTNDTNPANDRMNKITFVSNLVEITIGTGTSPIAYVPMHCGEAYSVMEDIYLQSEINYYGPITTLAFYKAWGTTLNQIESVAIFMKYTTEDTLLPNPWDTAGYSLVYNGSFPNNATSGWMQITLTNPFLYNNVENLRVLVIKRPPSFTGYPYWNYSLTSPARRTRYGYGTTLPHSLTVGTTRPNTRFLLDLRTRPQRDAGVRAILSPGNWQLPNIPMTAQARITNYGAATQTFPVTCSIVNLAGQVRHYNSQTITLASLAETTVTFTSFNPAVFETLNVNVRTNLTNDTNPSNDRMTIRTRITNTAEVIIGTGMVSASFVLMNCSYPYSVSNAIYLQSEIGYYGDIINVAYYKTGGTSLTPIESVSFFMRHTNVTSVTTGAWDTTGFTNVFNRTFPNDSVTGWLDVPIHNFTYNNGDNLEIIVVKRPPAMPTGYPSWRLTNTSPIIQNRYRSGSTALPTWLNQTETRPNIRLYLALAIPPSRDLGIEKIIAPSSIHLINTPMTPIAKVRNYGSVAQSAPVICSIIGSAGTVRYIGNGTVTNLQPGDTTYVSFTPTYNPNNVEAESVFMRTNLINDSVPANDRKSCATTVGSVQLQNFEASNGGYVANPSTAAWEWGVPTSGPMAAHSGTKLWATVLGGNYTGNANWKLTSDNFIASSDNPALQFWHWYDTEAAFDGGNVKISTDSGTTWTIITPEGGYPGIANSLNIGIASEPCFTGHIQGYWEQETFILPVDSGQSFMIRWHFSTDGSGGYPGWYIDDVIGFNFAWTGITEENINTISKTELCALKPNPVTNGVAHILFSIATPTKTSLKIYNASGRLIKTLVNEKLTNGTYDYIWNGTDNNSREVAEGIYFFTLTTDKNNFTKKLVFTR
jgi:hypothetical protein